KRCVTYVGLAGEVFFCSPLALTCVDGRGPPRWSLTVWWSRSRLPAWSTRTPIVSPTRSVMSSPRACPSAVASRPSTPDLVGRSRVARRLYSELAPPGLQGPRQAEQEKILVLAHRVLPCRSQFPTEHCTRSRSSGKGRLAPKASATLSVPSPSEA